MVARIAPMFGLMGTLIPLGPGLIALAQECKTLSDSLLIAFDTTVAGLISAAVSFVISGIRKNWYRQYMTGLETVMETILEEQDREAKSGRPENCENFKTADSEQREKEQKFQSHGGAG